MLRTSVVIAAATVASLAGVAQGGTITLDFENLSDFDTLDDQYLALGVDFQGTATALTAGYGHQSSQLPPYSGSTNISDWFSNYIRADAVGSTWTAVSARVTGSWATYLAAYDANGTLLGSASTGGSNYIGAGTPNALLTVSAPGIAYVIFDDTVGYQASPTPQFTVDDFTFTTAVVPLPPAAWLGLGLLGGLGLIRRLRRRPSALS